jgi:ComF family protein
MNFFENALDFLFPKICIICGKIDKNSICENCKKRIKKYEKFILITKDKENSEIYYDYFLFGYSYKGLMRKILLKYKFQGQAYICNFFAKMLLNCKKTYDFFSFYDIMIPVPMEKQKKLARGYNQAELIVDIIAKNAQISNGKNVICKIKNTKTQSLLNYRERQDNVKNAFFVSQIENVKNKRIILFDDIYTTGATVNEISRILKENGAEKILVLVIAKD